MCIRDRDGEAGFPGTVEARVWYTGGKVQDEGREKVALEVEYEVELVGDEVEETFVSVTNHRQVVHRLKRPLIMNS